MKNNELCEPIAFGEIWSFSKVFGKIYSKEMFAGQWRYNVVLFPTHALQRTMGVWRLFESDTKSDSNLKSSR